MNTSAKGNKGELKVAEELQDDGWVVGSRRHISGPGDLLATKPGERPRLIEVKTRKKLWEGFRREDREALREYAAQHGCVAEVAWLKPYAREAIYIDEASWPA